MSNYKTTIAALVGYVIILVNKYAGLDIPSEVVIGLVLCVVALVSKDYDTTGNGSNSTKSKSF